METPDTEKSPEEILPEIAPKRRGPGRPGIYNRGDQKVLKALGGIRGTSRKKEREDLAKLRGKWEVIAYKRLAKSAKHLADHAVKLAKQATVDHPHPLLRVLDKILPDAVQRMELLVNREAEEGRKYLDNLELDDRSIELLEELAERIIVQKTIDVTP